LRLSWPRSAQWTAAALLGAVLVLLCVQVFAGWMGSRGAEPAPVILLDVNRASRAELMQLPGVGPALAERIESHRQARGPFRRIDDLRQVSGIGPATLERLRGFLYVSEVSAPDEVAGASDRQESSPAKPAKKAAASKPAGKSKKAEELAGKTINVNRASLAELQQLPGVGPKIGQRIVDERSRKSFASVNDLRRVAGIGAKTLEKLRPYVTVGDTMVAGGGS
jgi:competence protein ComEA